jgi:hypothetical protein
MTDTDDKVGSLLDKAFKKVVLQAVAAVARIELSFVD